MEKTPIFDLTNLNNHIIVKKGTIHSFYTHTHLYNEMIIYEPFNGYISVNNEKIIIDEPTIVLVTTSSFHNTHTYGITESKCTKISFTADMISTFFSRKLNNSIILKEYNDSSLLCELISKLEDADDNNEYRKILLDSILLKLLESGQRIRSVESMNMNSLITDTLYIINSKFNENISLGSVAQELNVTPQYLSYVFSHTMNISFSQYLSDMRLRYASGLLLDNDMNITEICYSCGYRNLSHFIRSFKKKYGVSPNKFKK